MTDEASDPSDDGPPSVRPVIGGRHEARERAVHLLYEMAMKGRTADEVLSGQVVAADRYTADLVTGVDDHSDELDGVIGRLAKGGWSLERMPTMDVLVLRDGLLRAGASPGRPHRRHPLRGGRPGGPVRNRRFVAVRERPAGHRCRRAASRRGTARPLTDRPAGEPRIRMSRAGDRGPVVPSPPDRQGSPVRLLRTGRTLPMAERERRMTRPYGGVFIARSQVMDDR